MSGRFRAAGPRVRRGTLRLGREVAPGKYHIYVEVRPRRGRRRVVSTHFFVARPRAGLVRLRGVRNGARVPVRARVRVAAGARLRARLNGRNVRALFKRSGGRWLTGRLAAHDGLRFGPNRLVVTAFTENGRYQRLTRTFRVRRDRPLVGAGRDRRAVAGRPARLDGTSTRVARRGSRLRLRWQIVDRPRGARRARLRGSRSKNPRLVTRVPGRYTIRLRARELRRTGRRGARASALTPAATDSVQVTVQPDVLPKGVPVKTIVSSSQPGIQVGSEFYPAWLGENAWVQMLALDRATLEPIPVSGNQVNTYTGDWPGTGSLGADIAALPSNALVIVSGIGRSASLDSNAQNALRLALAGPNGIGAVLPDGVEPLQFGNFSFIGVPKAPPGSAYQCNITFCLIAPGALPGELSGFLQLDNTGNFAFNWPATFNGFDTRAPGSSSTQNVMQISFGENTPETYTSAQMNGPAFQLLWLDSGTLAVRGNFTYSATTGPTCGGSGCLQDMAEQLQKIVDDPVPGLIMLSSFGKPKVPDQSGLGSAQKVWAGIASQIQAMGGNPWVVLSLDGTGDYTFVGLEGLQELEGPNAGAELSEVETGAIARLAGLFERTSQGLWEPGARGNPDANNPNSVFQPDLTKILAQPDRPFPFPDSAAERAAEQYIARPAGLGGLELGLDPKFGIRANYWLDYSIDWDSKLITLQNMGGCRSNCPAGYDNATFQTVKNQLADEFGMINQLRDFFTGGGSDTLNGVLSSTFGSGAFDFTGVALDILQLYTQPAVEINNGPQWMQVIQGMLTIDSGVAGATPFIGGALAAPVTISRGALMIQQALTNNSDGTPALLPASFAGDARDWGANLEGASIDAVDSLALVYNQLVSDLGRLEAADAKIDLFGSDQIRGWGLNAQSVTQLQHSLTRSMGQYMWSSMLPDPSTVTACWEPLPRLPSGWLGQEKVTMAEVEPPDLGNPFLPFSPPTGNDTYFFPVYLVAVTPFGGPLPEDTYDTLFSTQVAPLSGFVNLKPKYFYAPANVQGGNNWWFRPQTSIDRLARTSGGFVLRACTPWPPKR